MSPRRNKKKKKTKLPPKGGGGERKDDDSSIKINNNDCNNIHKYSSRNASAASRRTSPRRRPPQKRQRQRPPFRDDDVDVDTDATASPTSRLQQQQQQQQDLTSTTTSTSTTPTDISIATSCWVCQVPLASSSDDKEEVCCYVSYTHKLLQTPLCTVCRDILEDEDDCQEEDYCHGCGNQSFETAETAKQLFLCDATACNYQFCDTCVARALGSTEQMQALLNAGTNEPWFCLACHPPCFLQDNLRLPVTSSISIQQQQQNNNSNKRTAQDALNELAVAEEKKRTCLQLLDHEDEQRQAIAQELQQQHKHDDIHAAVQDELETWKTQQLQHLTRLEDFIATLQDELELEYHMDTAYCYNELLPTNNETSQTQQQQQQEEEDTPEWVRQADRAIAKRIQQEEKQQQQNHAVVIANVLPEEIYERDDCYDSVEEIEDSDALLLLQGKRPHVLEHRSGFSRRIQPSAGQIRKAQQAEQERMAQLRVHIKTVVKEEQDVQQVWQENQETMTAQEVVVAATTQGGGGSMRIRRRRQQQQIPKPVNDNNKKNHITAEEEEESTITAYNATSSRGEVSTAIGSSNQNDKTRISPPAANKSPTKRIPPTSAQKIAKPTPRSKFMAENTVDLCSDTDDEEEEEQKPFIPKITVAAPQNKSSGSLCLCPSSKLRQVYVARALVKNLKPHQVEGIQFMWKSSFCDLEDHPEGHVGDERVGGCILAHNMGLGKTFTTIALLHTVMTHSTMRSATTLQPLIRRVLLVVPVNALASWESEFDKWLGSLPAKFRISNMAAVEQASRKNVIKRWRRSEGGVLLVSDKMFARFFSDKEEKKRKEFKEDLQPDVLVLDEAHTMLKTATTSITKALKEMNTNRRILLTGSPFQNNLFEYFRMLEFIRPGLFGFSSETRFEQEYANPIMMGLASDCNVREHSVSVSTSAKLSEIVQPYIHRKDVSALSKDLPAMSQVVLHVRQSRLQTRLYQRFQREQKEKGINNFFKVFTTLRPIHNHPFCLRMGNDRQGKERNSSSDEEIGEHAWWDSDLLPKDPLEDVESGYKIVLLLHILAYSMKLDEKVLIFTQCLKTLDYIERVLAADDWKSLVPSLECFEDLELGGWKPTRDYLRIDGSHNSSERGDLVDEFNRGTEEGGSVRAFLISSLAGSMGITLTAASRVVLVDSHFNPTVSTQSLFRCYRYGQEKEVFAYRLLTEGTIEEKVYSRSVNKTGLALRVVDKKTFNRCFSKKEVADLQETCRWVQCDRCEKWRMLLDTVADPNLPDEWFCEMNSSDPRNNKCTDPERDQFWYEKHCSLDMFAGNSQQDNAERNESTQPSSAQGEKDEILRHLLTVSESKKKSSLISRHYFHESLLETKQATEEVEEARRYLMEHEGSDNRKVAAQATVPLRPKHVANEGSAAIDKEVSRIPAQAPRPSVGQETPNRTKPSPGRHPVIQSKSTVQNSTATLRKEAPSSRMEHNSHDSMVKSKVRNSTATSAKEAPSRMERNSHASVVKAQEFTQPTTQTRDVNAVDTGTVNISDESEVSSKNAHKGGAFGSLVSNLLRRSKKRVRKVLLSDRHADSESSLSKKATVSRKRSGEHFESEANSPIKRHRRFDKNPPTSPGKRNVATITGAGMEGSQHSVSSDGWLSTKRRSKKCRVVGESENAVANRTQNSMKLGEKETQQAPVIDLCSSDEESIEVELV